MPPFLLPIFPIALSCAAAGFEQAWQRKWTIAGKVAAGLLIIMCLAGGAGLALYSQKPESAAIGLQIKTSYLEQPGQHYEVDEAIKRLLDGMDRRERALVFAGHLYYLQMPYLNRNPTTSFEVDPERLQPPQEWK